MPALNFQKQFVAAVESGKKCQTIRALRKDGRDPKPGDTLYLYYGMRTKQCRKLGEVECKSVDRIEILGIPRPWSWTEPRILLHPRPALTLQILASEAEEYARADGFSGFDAMHDWFQKTHGLPFEGFLIRWEAPECP